MAGKAVTVPAHANRLQVEVDEFICCSAGNCVLLAPEVFDQEEENGVVIVLTGRPGPEHTAAVREAAALCPVGAITVRPS